MTSKTNRAESALRILGNMDQQERNEVLSHIECPKFVKSFSEEIKKLGPVGALEVAVMAALWLVANDGA